MALEALLAHLKRETLTYVLHTSHAQRNQELYEVPYEGDLVKVTYCASSLQKQPKSEFFRPQNSLEELFGPTLHLNASTLEVSFPTAFQRLHISFYRSKLTSWMAAQEEDYRCG